MERTNIESLNRIFDSLDETIWCVDLETNQLIYISKSAEDLYGCSNSEFYKNPDYWLEFVHPEDMKIIEGFQQKLNTDRSAEYEYRIIRKDNSIRWVRDRTRIIKNNRGEYSWLTGVLVDITHLKNKQQQIQESEIRFRKFFEKMNVGAAFIDMYYSGSKTENFIIINEAFKNFIGYSEKELNKLSISEITVPEDYRKEVELFNQAVVSPSRSFDFEKRYVRKGGAIVWGHLYVLVVDHIAGYKTSFITIIVDITQKKEMELELIAAKEKAEEMTKVKSQFLSVISHEIRTPLNAVIGVTDLLMQDNPKQEQVENLNTLKFSANNLLLLINDILDFNKIEANKVELELKKVDLRFILNGIKDSIQKQGKNQGNQIEITLNDSVPLSFIGDPVRIGQIYLNLIFNAVKFTSDGLVSVLVQSRDETETEITIYSEIEDNGIGIESSKLNVIFDSFMQGSSDTTRKYGGSGLGLAIAKKLIELMNGTISVESEVGKGSIFKFSIRVSKDLESTKTADSGKTNNVSKDLKGMKILVVEDNSINVKVVMKFLSKWNTVTEFADNGLIAVEKVRNSHYDLILMDLQMPVMDGMTAAVQIRSFNRDVPIIALTADITAEVKLRSQEIGMNDYITKPFDSEDLYLKVKAFLKS